MGSWEVRGSALFFEDVLQGCVWRGRRLIEVWFRVCGALPSKPVGSVRKGAHSFDPPLRLVLFFGASLQISLLGPSLGRGLMIIRLQAIPKVSSMPNEASSPVASLARRVAFLGQVPCGGFQGGEAPLDSWAVEGSAVFSEDVLQGCVWRGRRLVEVWFRVCGALPSKPVGSVRKGAHSFDPPLRLVLFFGASLQISLLGPSLGPSLGRGLDDHLLVLDRRASSMPNEASSPIALLARRGVKGSRPLAGCRGRAPAILGEILWILEERTR